MRTTYMDIKTRAIVDVDPAEACPPGVRRIARISVPAAHRGKGAGSQLMAQVCADADQENLSLQLEPIPYDGPEKLDDLLRFYDRFGFELVGEIGYVRVAKTNQPA